MNNSLQTPSSSFQSSYSLALASQPPAQAFYFQPTPTQDQHSSSSEHLEQRSLSQRGYSVDDDYAREEKLEWATGLWKCSGVGSRGLTQVIHEEERKSSSKKIRLFEKMKRNKDYDDYDENFDKMSTKSQDEMRTQLERKYVQQMEFNGMNHDSQYFRLKDTFKGLSTEDRVLCISSIDKHSVESIIRMRKKASKHGEGKFTLKTRILTQKTLDHDSHEEITQHVMSQDYCFASLKELSKVDKCTLSQHSQTLQSEKVCSWANFLKELLSFIRITETFQERDTMTALPALTKDADKFFNLLEAICGQMLFKIPPESKVEVDKECMISSIPIWFSPQEYSSLAKWICYYIERAMWIQYKIYVKGELLPEFELCKKQFLVEPDGTLVHARVELLPFWREQQAKQKKDPKLGQQLEEELVSSSYESFQHELQFGFIQVNQLTGGLADSHKGLLMILQREQDPENFLANLAMISLDRLNCYPYYPMEKKFIEILKKKQLEDLERLAHPNQKKNQKKKQKKKQKQQKQLAEMKKQEELKGEEEEEKEQPQVERKEQKVEDFGPIEEMDFNSNQMIMLNSNYYQNLLTFSQEEQKTSHSAPVTQELQRLYVQLVGPLPQGSSPQPAKDQEASPSVASPKEVSQPVQEALFLPTPLFFESLRTLEEITVEAYKDEVDSKKDESSEQSESTDDQLETQGLRKKEESITKKDTEVGLEQINIENELPPNEDLNLHHQGAFNTRFQQELVDLANERFEVKEQNFQSEKKKKKKKDMKVKANYQGSQHDKEGENEDYSSNSFFIIRSQKGFNTGNQNNLSTQVKKKKKKRTKPVLFNAWSSQDQSSKLNTFMRNIVSTSPVEEEGEDQYGKAKDKSYFKQTNQRENMELKQRIYVPKSKIIEESKGFESDNQMGDSIWQNSEDQQLLLGVQLSRKQNRQHSQEKFPQKEAPIFANSFQKKDQFSNKFESFLCDTQNSQSMYSFRSNEDDFTFMGKNSMGDLHKKSKWPSQKNKPKPKKKAKPNDMNNFSFMKRNSIPGQLGYMANYNLDPYYRQKTQAFDQNLENFGFYPQMSHSPPVLDLNCIQQLISDVLIQKHQSQTPPYPAFQNDLNFPSMWPEGQMWMGQDPYKDPYNQDLLGEANQERLYDERVEQFFELLETEMILFEKDNEKKLNSVRKEREQVISIIQEHIQKTYNGPNYQHSKKAYQKNFVSIKMYGSMASGLAIDSSDVDIAVTGLSFKGNKEAHLKEMKNLQESLSILSNSFTSVKFIDSATVPVIKLQIDMQKMRQKIIQQEVTRFGKTNTPAAIDQDMRLLGMDITFEDMGPHSYTEVNQYGGSISKINLGIECVNYISSLCMQLKDLKPIVLILKKLLQCKNLNQPYLGGLSSYSLVLLTSSFLKSQNTNSMAKNLTEFLNYYGNFFNPYMTQLDGENFYPIYEIRSDPIIVNDPLNQHNNTTRNAFRIQEVLNLFRKSHQVIVKSLDEFQLEGEGEAEERTAVRVIEKIVSGQLDA